MPDLTGLTVPCDGTCGIEEFHTAHLAPDWERILNRALGVEDNPKGDNHGDEDYDKL